MRGKVPEEEAEYLHTKIDKLDKDCSELSSRLLYVQHKLKANGTENEILKASQDSLVDLCENYKKEIHDLKTKLFNSTRTISF